MRFLAASRRYFSDLHVDPPADWIGRTVYEIFPDVAVRLRDVHQRVLRSGETLFADEQALQRADGRTDWVRWEVTPWRDAGGEIGGVIIFRETITARKDAETRWRDGEERLRLALEGTGFGIWEWRQASDLVEWSESCWPLYGLAPRERPLRWAEWCELIHPDDLRRIDQARRVAFAAHAPALDSEFRIRLPDGRERWLLSRSQVIYDNGVPVRLVGINIDISRLKKAEEALAHLNAGLEMRVRAEIGAREDAQRALARNERAQVLNQLAVGIAHDFNNVLAAVANGYAVIRRSSSEPTVREAVEIGGIAVERASRLVKQILMFARPQELAPDAIDLHVLFDSFGILIEHGVGERIACVFDLPDDIWPVMADAEGLQLALLNLVSNARDVMCGEGSLVVAARNVAAHASDGAAAAASGFVAISVTDTGPGFDPEVLHRATEPFFTTKPVGSGSGLGLAIVEGFVTQSGGTLLIRNEPGQGATVELLLPRAHRMPVASSSPRHVAPLPTGNGTILLVDDDGAVRASTSMLLRSLGYRIYEACDAPSALARARTLDRLDLVVTDIVMPGGSGPTLVARLRAEQPTLSVIYVTGYMGDDEPVGDEVVLRKPFSDHDIANRVAEAMMDARWLRRVAANQ